MWEFFKSAQLDISSHRLERVLSAELKEKLVGALQTTSVIALTSMIDQPN